MRIFLHEYLEKVSGADYPITTVVFRRENWPIQLSCGAACDSHVVRLRRVSAVGLLTRIVSNL